MFVSIAIDLLLNNLGKMNEKNCNYNTNNKFLIITNLYSSNKSNKHMEKEEK